MNHARPHMLNGVGVGFPPSAATAGNLGNLNGLGGMGAMGNMGGMGNVGNAGNIGGMGGLGNVGSMGGMGGGPHQQHPGQHAGQPPMNLLQNHQQQQQQHQNPPPMGGLHAGANPPQIQNHAPGQGGQLQGQQPSSMAYLQQQQRQQQHEALIRQERHRLQQQQHQQQQQQQQHQQVQQGFPPGGNGGSGLGMSPMGSYGSPRMAGLASTGNVSGVGTMTALGGMGGMGAQGNLNGVGSPAAYQNIPQNPSMAQQLQQGMGMRRVPSQAGQAGQPQQPMNGAGMNMGMLGGMGVGAMGGMGMVPNGLSSLRQPGMPGAQRIPSFPGAQQPGQLQPGQSRTVQGPQDMPPGLAAAVAQHRGVLDQPQHVMANQHPRTPSVQSVNPPMPPGGNANPLGNAGGQIPNSINPNPVTPGLRRTPSAQSIAAPGLIQGGLHPGHPSAPNHTNPNHPQQHSQQGSNPPPFTNPLHHNMQSAQLQQHQHQLSGQQHHLGQHPHPQPSGLQGVPMPGMAGMHHAPGPGPGPGPSPMPGGMPGHQGQQHPNAGSPPRPATGGQQHPATPAVAPTGLRPQSRTEQPAILGFPGGATQPPFSNALRQPNQHQLGQSGQLGHPFGPQGMGVGGRTTPQQSPMAALRNSPGGPVGGRPGSSAGGGGVGIPNLGMVGIGGRAGPVPQGAPGFPTPAQQLQADQQQQQVARNFVGAMSNPNAQGPQPQRSPSRVQAHAQPFSSPLQGMGRANSPAAHRQGTPLSGTPTLAHAHHVGMPQAVGSHQQHQHQQQQHAQHAHAMQQNRPPSRQVATPSLQHNQPPPQQQAGPSQTPQTQHAGLPTTPGAGPSVPLLMQARSGVGLGIPPMHGQQQQQPLQSAGLQQIPQQQNMLVHGQQRPLTQDGAAPGAGLLTMPTFIGPRQAMYPPYQQAINRLLSLSDTLSQPKSPLSKDYWEGVVQEFFSSKATVKFTLWKDSAQQEAKPFDISMPILPRFFLVTSQSGVRSMSISLENAKERNLQTGGSVYSSYVECQNAAWTFRYSNGYIVTLRGMLTAHIILHPNAASPPVQSGVNGAVSPAQLSLKFEHISFNARTHEKALRIDAIEGKRREPVQRTPKMKPEPSPGTSTIASSSSPPQEEEYGNGELVVHIDGATIPVEPVNAFGIPQATMRCLELAESVGHMSDLIGFSLMTNSGPKDALKKYAHMLRERQAHIIPPHQSSPGYAIDGNFANSMAPSPAVTLYQSSPVMEPATTNSGGLQPPPGVSHRPGQSQGAGDTSSPNMASTPVSAQTPSAPPLSAGPTSTSSTPMLPPANLKRKAGETSSPTTTEQQQPPPKRTQRKRSIRHGGS
ncbi:hypothetical protein M0805_000784 [Coniferiporia weirii]|nr:hypothetical protein M0805_000784 [Coniferiporia weirii]